MSWFLRLDPVYSYTAAAIAGIAFIAVALNKSCGLSLFAAVLERYRLDPRLMGAARRCAMHANGLSAAP